MTTHKAHERPGLNDPERQEACAALFEYAIDPDDANLIRAAALCSMPTGDSRFKAQIEQALQRRLGYVHRGRPGRRVNGM